MELNVEVLAEKLAVYYAENPSIAFKAAWAAYCNNYLHINEAAAAIGSTPQQFLELGLHGTNGLAADIPEILVAKANSEEKFLISLLPQRLVDILSQLLIKDILLAFSSPYVGTLKEDMHLLKRLKLVTEKRRGNLYQYSLNLNG